MLLLVVLSESYAAETLAVMQMVEQELIIADSISFCSHFALGCNTDSASTCLRGWYNAILGLIAQEVECELCIGFVSVSKFRSAQELLNIVTDAADERLA